MSTIKTMIVALLAAAIGAAMALTAYTQLMPTSARVINRTVVVNKAASTKGTKLLSPEQIYTTVSPAVVNVSVSQRSTDLFGAPHEGESASGSGFVIDKSGLVVTNEHVVEDAATVRVTLADQTEAEAKVLGTDTNTDLALLKIEPNGHELTTLKFGDSDDLQVGDTVYAIGNPLGLERSMSQGIISALNRSVDAPSGFSIRKMIQTDAAINRGNSGGALIDIEGKVVGVTAQIATSGGSGNIGIAFAIPSNTVRDIVSQIRKTGKAEHAWLGISGRTVTKKLAKDLDLPVTSGALLAGVFSGGPADKAGMRRTTTLPNGKIDQAGDVIVSLNGRKVASMEDLVTLVDERHAGEKIRLEIYRGKEKKTVTVELAARPSKLTQ